MTLDIGVGRDLEKKLCATCHERLREKIKKRHVLLVLSGPRGYARLHRMVYENTCPECRGVIGGSV